ncbi:MAG: hypothetical protein GWO07_15205 [Candidatus Dadabacteria bacterium]|nr:hypothetical protein [Candidatus Dadabacteria bacterium]NIS10060.1 hypothetical protein [Candidatus Dadabacteria bacterium]NIV42137.1 hypothetical protein [Candidatus Dadabacteria bacterium]NIX16446.1 hypothetical protein [Candidatus Dadabacteria bacterium]NIY23007.1 hypothetical protein [Candidatus Dadabacteria bacterium]
MGGRVWTDTSIGAAMDMGASWIHGTSGNPIKKIASDLEIKTTSTNYDDLILFNYDGQQISEIDML